ncbi:MAG: hypothetical protein AB7O62_01195 [Pirellulales bacterium]
MKRWLILLLVVGAVAGGWAWSRRDILAWQYACHQIGQAKTLEDAVAQISALDTEPDRTAKLHELVGGWGRGSQTFDAYLAQYLMRSECSEELRHEFSGEIGWRPELLPRWGHFWNWRHGQHAQSEFDSVRSFLETLRMAETKRSIGWREVLNLQAMFVLTGKPDLARHLTPKNWSDRFRRWQEAETEWTELPSAEQPFPDWKGGGGKAEG